jgi:hypothetical protein
MVSTEQLLKDPCMVTWVTQKMMLSQLISWVIEGTSHFDLKQMFLRSVCHCAHMSFIIAVLVFDSPKLQHLDFADQASLMLRQELL